MSYILHICSWFPHEGDPQNGVFIRQHIEITQDSFLPVIICNTPKNHKHIAPDSFEVHNLRAKTSKWSKIKQAKKIFKQLLTEKGAPTAIHLHVVAPLGLLALIAKKFFDAPIIITEHWTGYRTGLFSKAPPLHKIIAKKVFLKAKKAIVVSESLKQDLLALRVCQQDKIVVCPNPILLFPRQGPQASLRQSGINMLSVADFNEANKNFLGILSAFEQATIEYPNLHWTIIGDGPDKTLFENTLANSSAKNKVHLLGRQSQNFVHQHYSEFDFLVSFSRFETFAMVPAEAIMAGIPVIATRCGGPEYYVNDRNGIVIKSEDDEALAQAIINLSQSFQNFSPSQLKLSLPKAFLPENFKHTITNLYIEN